MTDQLFKDEPNSNPQATPEPAAPIVNTNDLFSDQLAAIKNDQGAPKYTNVEDAIVALQHSQKYIPELKDKVSTQEQLILDLQAKLEAKENVQEIIQRQATPNEQVPTSPTSLSEEDVAALVMSKLKENETNSTKTTNQATVNSTLQAKYGTEAQAKIAQKAAELGMKPSELGELSKQNPAMVLALFGEKQTGNVSPTVGGYNLPRESTDPEPLKRPDKSILSGATAKQQGDFMRQIKEEIYRKHGITQ